MCLCMFKLAHISDIHLGPLPKLTIRELATKRITGFVNWHRHRRKHLFGLTLETLMEDIKARAPDHLAVTGDLVNLGSKLEIEGAALWLKSIGTPAETSLVPGNHDAYVPGAIGKATLAWHAYVRGDHSPQSWNAEEKLFPYLRVRGPAAIIGCSTAVATPPFSASGYFSRRQARETAKLLQKAGEAGLFRVVMIHHPPIRGATHWHKRMVGIRRFAAAIRLGGAELVLHGHTHLNTVNWIATPNGKVPVVGIASASQGPGGKKPVAAYNLFSISGSKGNWSLIRQRYALNAGAMTMDLAETDDLSVN
jgi:3',5'-cyclic AMP phosphodiesterase CpdA